MGGRGWGFRGGPPLNPHPPFERGGDRGFEEGGGGIFNPPTSKLLTLRWEMLKLLIVN